MSEMIPAAKQDATTCTKMNERTTSHLSFPQKPMLRVIAGLKFPPETGAKMYIKVICVKPRAV